MNKNRKYMDRRNISITQDLASKFDVIRLGESWQVFLSKVYPVLFDLRQPQVEKKLKELELEVRGFKK